MEEESGLALSAFDVTAEEFRERIAWAESTLTPRWLWPEMDPADWRRALRAIESAARDVMTLGAAREPLDGDPAAIGLAGFTSGMGPLLGYWIEQGQLAASAPVAAVLDLHLRHNRLRMARMAERAAAVARALAAEGVSVTVLKGMHTAFAYFPDPGTRPLSDVDMFVASDADAEQANAYFERSGFVLRHHSFREHSWRPAAVPAEARSLLLAHADDPWSIDLHNSLDQFPARGAPPVRLDAIAAAVPMTLWPIDVAARALGQPLLLLQLAVHASCGFDNLTMIRLVELALVARRDIATGELQWPAFLDIAEQAGGLGVACPALMLCEALVPGTIPAAVLASCAKAAPRRVRKRLARLTPASAQSLDRRSLAEHFMWSRGWRGLARQVRLDLAPAASLAEVVAINKRRAAALWRRGFNR